jgi:methylated-DNA-[protein]-cysteine S-methyltransferase
MSTKPSVCREIEMALVATATGEADAAAARRVREHVDGCAPCREELARYRAIDAVALSLRGETVEPAPEARASLRARLADLRRRLVSYGIFPSPLGHILIARSEEGVSLVEYLGSATTFGASRLHRVEGVEAERDGAEIARLHRELLEYLAGDRADLGWRLDWRLARSDFHRRVLEATARVPYGAVASYAGIARRIGRPEAARAVAQALRWNPLPIVVPCHRIIGASGALTGYAGNKLGLKQRLLSVEGVRIFGARHDLHVARDAMYVRDEQYTEYCVPTCGSLATRPLAELTLYASRARAEASGLTPCGTCRPDLHPLPV